MKNVGNDEWEDGGQCLSKVLLVFEKPAVSFISCVGRGQAVNNLVKGKERHNF